VDLLVARGYEVINLDIVPPQARQAAHWTRCSILDPDALRGVLAGFRPDHILHLAAYASMEAKSIDEFRVNIEGTRNVVEAARACALPGRLVITSSQHVRRPGSGNPANDKDYVPYGFYGESKVRTEQITRDAGLGCAWTIVRPTAVWGPYQPPLADGIWRLLKKGIYIHPSGDPVVRSYGYVGNVVWQIVGLLETPVQGVHGRTFYVGDENIRQFEWINAFSLGLAGRPVRTVPLWLIRILAAFGDAVGLLGLRFPIYGSRLYNLTTPNPVPIAPIMELLGRPPNTLDDGIRATTAWLDEYFSGRAVPGTERASSPESRLVV